MVRFERQNRWDGHAATRTAIGERTWPHASDRIDAGIAEERALCEAERICEIKRQIEDGTYLDDDKLDAVVDMLFTDLTGSKRPTRRVAG